MKFFLVKWLLADAVLLLMTYFVLQDLGWRTAYASSAHPGTTGYSPSFAYSFLTQYFTMNGGVLPLQSPPTLDWIQILVIALLAVNGWYIYTNFVRKNPMVKAQV